MRVYGVIVEFKCVGKKVKGGKKDKENGNYVVFKFVVVFKVDMEKLMGFFVEIYEEVRKEVGNLYVMVVSIVVFKVVMVIMVVDREMYERIIVLYLKMLVVWLYCKGRI